MGYASANLPGYSATSAATGLQRMRGLVTGGWLLALSHVAAAAAALAIAASASLPFFGPEWVVATDLPLTAVAVAVVAPNWCLGLYSAATPGPIERFRLHAWGAMLLPWIATSILGFFGSVSLSIFGVLCITAALSIPLALVLETYLRRILMAHSLWGTTALLVGPGDTVAHVSRFLIAHPEFGLRPVGYVGESARPGTGVLPPRLGEIADVEHFAKAAEVALVVLSLSTRALELSRLPFQRVLFVQDLGNSPALWTRSRAIGDVPALEFINRARTTYARHTKRLFDLAVAVPLLLSSLPILGLLALTIKLVSPGPAFYSQRRIGQDGKVIQVLKLRSMLPDADQRLQELLARDPEARAEWERHVKLRNDPRILPLVGRFIRRTSLDELPQLWNVARGDISLVGPRPFPAYHVSRFDPAFQALRQSIRPGLTGLWQVSDRSDANLPQQEALDTFYIRNWSIWLDLWIVLHTLPAVLNARGAR